MSTATRKPGRIRPAHCRVKPSQHVRLQQFLEFLHRTRCTADEALRLKWSDIDADIIRLRHRRRPVLFWLDPVAIRLLESIRECEYSNAFVFAHIRMLTTANQELRVFGGTPKERQGIVSCARRVQDVSKVE